MTARPSVSIVVVTRNGMRTLPRWMDAIDGQISSIDRDVLAVDSGSTDGTPEFLASRGVQVRRIAPEEFNHGATRNEAIALTRGNLIVLIVQDAIPAGPHWLETLIAPFASDSKLAGAFARQVPAREASALTRWSLERWAGSSTAPRRVEPMTRDEYNALPPLARYERCIFDNVCACLRRDVWARHPFRAVPIAEDLEWARDVLLDGWRLAYIPDAVVEHSHDRSAWYELRRTYLVHRRLHELFGLSTIPTPAAMIGSVARTVPAHLRVTRGAQARSMVRALALGVAWPAGQYLGARAARRGRPAPRFRNV